MSLLLIAHLLRQIQVFLTDYSTPKNTLQQIKYIWSVNPGGPGTAGFADRTEQSVSDSSSARSAKYADIAQPVEQRPFKAWVGGSIELRYDCHRQSLVLFIRCAEHHPLSAPSHGRCSQAVRQRIVVPPIAGSTPVIYPK